jgi:cytochrome oxidase Cu insertion factor (SCO1/SenC/PrrC family)
MNSLNCKMRIAVPICLLIFLCWGVYAASAQYKVGDTVSDFALVDVNGDSISLFDYRGKVILLNFFTVYG